MVAKLTAPRLQNHAEAFVLLKSWGSNKLHVKRTPGWRIFLKQLYLPMPLLIWAVIACEFPGPEQHNGLLWLPHMALWLRSEFFLTSAYVLLVEAAIGDWANAAVLSSLQICNAVFSWREETKSGDAVSALRNSLAHTATVKRDGRWGDMDASSLVPGDLVLLHAGCSVPADCILNSREVQVDESTLTGELLPLKKGTGSSVKMGTTVTAGEAEATVQATGAHTYMGRSAAMLDSVSQFGRMQKVLLAVTMVGGKPVPLDSPISHVTAQSPTERERERERERECVGNVHSPFRVCTGTCWFCCCCVRRKLGISADSHGDYADRGKIWYCKTATQF